MQLDPQKIYIKNPDGNTLQTFTTGDFAGETIIDGQIHVLTASPTFCEVKCASPCTPQIYQITFSDVDFGDCNDCGKSIGFGVRLQRDTDFDNQTYLDYSQLYSFVYQGNAAGSLSGVVSAADLAQYFVDYINTLQQQNDQHDVFLATANIDPSDPNSILIELPCDGLVTYEFEGIYQLPNSNLETSEIPVFTEVQAAVNAYYSKEQLLQEAPLMAGHIFGEYPKEFHTWCENACVILLKGCIDPCAKPYEYQNSGHLHTGATPYQLMLIVNSSAPGYANFIASLNNDFTACGDANGGTGISDAPGIQGPGAVAAISGGSAVLDLTTIDFGDGTNSYTLSNGAVTVTAFNVTDGADLQAKLTAAYPSGTFAFSAPNLTVSGTFAAQAAGNSVTIQQVVQPYNSGE